MAVQFVTDISVDFYDKRYILINAKQYDKNSRFLAVTCYNHGKIFPLNAGEHAAYIRYKKPDNYSVFNFCEINNKGKIIVELTEQMLSVQGVALADLVVVNKGDAKVDKDTLEITSIENASVLSSMLIYVDVSRPAIEDSNPEINYEFSLINTTLEGYWAKYEEIMNTAKSWAKGNTGIRAGEDTDNAKYYCEQAKGYRDNAATIRDNMSTSQSNAITEINRLLQENIGLRDEALDIKNDVFDIKSETETLSQNAEISASNAAISADEASSSASEAAVSKNNADISASQASISASNAKTSETNASNSAKAAGSSASNASISESNAQTYMNESKTSENNAFNYANKAQSYAVGGTGTRQGEDTDNAYYYYEMTKTVIEGLQGGYMPMGTISFSELATVEKATGYVYNMREDFVTDESFREGAGKSYTAGTNVYYTADGQWDALGGAASPTATVSEVKDYLGI